MSRTRRAAVCPTWSRWPDAVALVARGATLRVAGPVALIVGTVLTAVNQGSVLLGGAVNWATWARVAANYAIPFVVASVGYLGARRVPPGIPAGEPPTAAK